MRLLFKYIYQFRKAFLFFLIFSLISFGVFELYDTNSEAVIYAFMICAVIGVSVVCIGFLRFRKRCNILKDIYENLPLMAEQLPPPDDITQKMLCDMILKLQNINQSNLTRINSIRQDNTDYFTVWVHQIKTPIAAMQMILQNEETDMCHELNAELFRIEQYAEMALQYIRLDSSTNDLVIRQYRLDSIIKQAVRRYAPLFIRRKIRLEYEPVSAKVVTDEKWLSFVVEQLLSNAVKYTYSGSVTITYSDNVLSVSDTGIGISAEDLPRIFEKGYTGMSGRTEKKSTGLGLYLCKTVCGKLGHKIYAESEAGKGTVVHVDLTLEHLDLE
ncbi:MAG: sensor histidine kinase [Ruminococcus sp.]|nr:sensor histidine kinase [Ruminococcus sp.]